MYVYVVDNILYLTYFTFLYFNSLQ